MKTRIASLSGLLVSFVLIFGSVVHAQTPADPYAFTTRVYRMPGEELAVGFVSRDKGKLRAPELPPASASAGEQEAFLKRSHAVVAEYLNQQGIALTKGSLAAYDPVSQTLVLRAMNAQHDMVDPFAKVLRDHSPKVLAWLLTIVEAPAADVRAAMAECAAKQDHKEPFDRLLGKGRVATSLRGQTKSGQRAFAQTGGSSVRPARYLADERFVEAESSETKLGTRFELDPVLGPDGGTIDVNVSLHHQYAPPQPRWEPLTSDTADKMEAQVFDQAEAAVQSAISMWDGAVELLGVWVLTALDAPARAGNMQAAFFQMRVVPLMPLMDPRIERMIAEHGEAVEPTPKNVRPTPDPALPPGMIVRRFHVPPDFTSSAASEGAAPADPFAAAPPANEPRFTRRVTLEEILRSEGVPFPDGASANYVRSTEEVVIRNTLANVRLAEDFFATLRQKSPTLIRFTLHVVQGAAALIRRIEGDAIALPDHAAAWKEISDAALAGSVNHVRSLSLQTKSGQRCSAEDVIRRSCASGVKIDAASLREEGKKEGGKASEPRPGVSERPHTRLIATQTEAIPVGLRMECDPIIGPDGATIDVNFSFDFDYAPPTVHAGESPPPERTRRLAVPVTEFHRSQCVTSSAWLSGATRLISVWKPEGAPDAAGDLLQAAFLQVHIVSLADK